MNLVSTWSIRGIVAVGALVALTACEKKVPGAKPDAVQVELAPDVVSSLDGTLSVHARVVDAATALRERPVRLTIEYVDRNGIARAVAGSSAALVMTDRTGVADHVFSGLIWEGSGTVRAEVLDDQGQPFIGREGTAVTGEATFSVVDQTPPEVTILSVFENKVGPNLPVDIQVQAQDEIGISQVFFEVAGEATDSNSSLVASGTTNGTVTFSFDVPGGAVPGPTIVVYAMAADLSGNLSAATPVTLTVDPAITIAVPVGFTASVVTSELGNFLNAPRAIAVSPKDGMLYVADNSGGAPCNGRCIRRVDPANGTVAAAAVAVGNGAITGIAFDATGDNLYYSDLPERIVRLTYNAGASAYQSPTLCNAPGNLPGPNHLIVDPVLGLLVVDIADDFVRQQAACDMTVLPVDFADLGVAPFGTPFGIAAVPGDDFRVSDINNDHIADMDAAGNLALWESVLLDVPLGIDWLAGGTTIFADSLFAANVGNNRIVSTKGPFTARRAASLANDPVDVAFAADRTLYILSDNPGRIYKVTGY